MQGNSTGKRNIIALAIILVAATVYYFFIAQGAPSMRFSKEDGTFAFFGPKNTSVQFSFDDLTRLELYDDGDPDWGEPVDGGEVLGGNRWGTWQSDSLGEYQAFVAKRIPAFILVSDGANTAIFNQDNRETTVSLYQQMLAFKNGELEQK